MIPRYTGFTETKSTRSGHPVLVPDIPEAAYIVDELGFPMQLPPDAPVISGVTASAPWDIIALSVGLDEEDWWAVAFRNFALGAAPDLLIPPIGGTIMLLSDTEANNLIDEAADGADGSASL